MSKTWTKDGTDARNPAIQYTKMQQKTNYRYVWLKTDIKRASGKGGEEIYLSFGHQGGLEGEL